MFLDGFSLFVLAVLAVAAALVFMGVKSIPQGSEYTVERFGRYTRTLRPGLHLIVPFIDRIGAQHQHDGAGDGRAFAGGHHQGQRHGDGRRRGLLPGAGSRERRL